MIEIPNKTLVDSATADMITAVRTLLYDFHTEDHENIYVPIFSDDGGITRIVWRELTQDANRRFALATSLKLKENLAAARKLGKSVVCWGILGQ